VRAQNGRASMMFWSRSQ